VPWLGSCFEIALEISAGHSIEKLVRFFLTPDFFSGPALTFAKGLGCRTFVAQVNLVSWLAQRQAVVPLRATPKQRECGSWRPFRGSLAVAGVDYGRSGEHLHEPHFVLENPLAGADTEPD
jgi:hypothetical protein